MVRGTVLLQGEVFRDGLVKVPLLSGGTVVDGLAGPDAVPLVVESGTVMALLRGPAPFTLTIHWAGQIGVEPGRAEITLPAVRAGSVHATLDLPGENVELRAEPGIVDSRSSSGGRTVVGITVDSATASRVTWSSREQVTKAPREARYTAEARSLITVGESDLRLVSLFDVAVTQGEPERLSVALPSGFDLVGVSGGTVESAGTDGGLLRLDVREPARRRHQFLLTLERNVAGGVTHGEVVLPAIDGALRETGEVALTSAGTVELTVAEKGALRRLDVSELAAALVSLTRSPLLSAFRYQRRGTDRVPVEFDVRRFADAPVLAAVADRSEVTTLLTSEGRTLTEVSLTVRNRGQLFLKLGLPAGASLLSAEVGGQPVKPVEGVDGARVPLVRTGFNPSGSYGVTFVYVSSGAALGKKGQAALTLPRMDLPIGVIQWELFLPDRYEIKRFDGDLLPSGLLPGFGAGMPGRVEASVADRKVEADRAGRLARLAPGEVGGRVVDPTGAVIPGATISVIQGPWRRDTVSDASGTFLVQGAPPGLVTVEAALEGFRTSRYQLRSAGGSPMRITLEVGALTETVTVMAEAAVVRGTETVTGEREARQRQQAAATPQSQAASQNVLSLQRRASGVLPVRIDIPRAGRSYVLVRPLVVDEETTVRFDYKTR